MGLRLTLLGFPENTTPELLLGIAGYFIRQDASSTLILSIALWRTGKEESREVILALWRRVEGRDFRVRQFHLFT